MMTTADVSRYLKLVQVLAMDGTPTQRHKALRELCEAWQVEPVPAFYHEDMLAWDATVRKLAQHVVEFHRVDF